MCTYYTGKAHDNNSGIPMANAYGKIAPKPPRPAPLRTIKEDKVNTAFTR